ncbi:MAG: hypothetical protein FWG65_13100 [Turicibacter sp.]|nr:hypothetical protein [Turicibacter sp.]
MALFEQTERLLTMLEGYEVTGELETLVAECKIGYFARRQKIIANEGYTARKKAEYAADNARAEGYPPARRAGRQPPPKPPATPPPKPQPTDTAAADEIKAIDKHFGEILGIEYNIALYNEYTNDPHKNPQELLKFYRQNVEIATALKNILVSIWSESNEDNERIWLKSGSSISRSHLKNVARKKYIFLCRHHGENRQVPASHKRPKSVRADYTL